ncbi:KH domain protein [Aphelenchoides besseyi]|nr:KH domain protein [Aphelenchoides besseyi]
MSRNSESNIEDDTKWLPVRKRRASTRNEKEKSEDRQPREAKDSSTAKDPLRALTKMMHANSHISNVWTNSSRRHSYVFGISVKSSTVARVIGRGGQNINMIRETTNAYIEVEKIATRPETQPTRQITFKGTVELIRKALLMIDLLIREADTPVGDIVRRVQEPSNGRATAKRKSNVEKKSPVVLPPIVALEKSPPTQQPSVVSQKAGASSPSNSTSGLPNVWQQWAESRKQQEQSDQLDETQKPTPVSSTVNSTASVSPQRILSESEFVSRPSAVEQLAMSSSSFNTPTFVSKTSQITHSNFMSESTRRLSAQEFERHLQDLQQMAPGYERVSMTERMDCQSPLNQIGYQTPVFVSRAHKCVQSFNASYHDNENFTGCCQNSTPLFASTPFSSSHHEYVQGNSMSSRNESFEMNPDVQRAISEIWSTPQSNGDDKENMMDQSSSFDYSPLETSLFDSFWMTPTSADGFNTEIWRQC